MKKNYTLPLVLLFMSFSLWLSAQDQLIKGTVTDASDGTALIGVNVIVVGTTNGTITDFNGNYELNAPSNGQLSFTYVGYGEGIEDINGRSIIDYTMGQGVQIDEVVVTAFGMKKKEKELTYAVSQVDAKDIELSGHNDPLSALQGRVAGLQINNNSGSAGGGVDILIRGISSVNPGRNNQPLIIVDGIAINNDNISGNVLPSDGSNSPASSEQFAFSSRSGDINPEDIESYSVLKGAAATALYGIRAANGAILITTKKGKTLEPKISVTTSISFRDVVTTPEQQQTYREGWAGRPEILYTPNEPSGFTKVHSSTPFHTWGPKYSDDSYEFSPENIVDLTGDRYYDPYELFQTGVNSQINFNIAGASDRFDYFFSLGKNDDKSIVPNSNYGKTNVRFNGGYKISDNLRIGSSISYTNSGGRRANGGDKSIISSLAYFSPTFPINDYKNSDGTQRNYTPWIDNPRYFAEVSSLTDNVDRWIGNTSLNWDPVDWFTLNYTFQIDNYSDTRNRFVPPELDTGTKVGGFVINELINFTGKESNLLAIFRKKLSSKWGSSLTLGNQISDSKRLYNRLSGEGLNIPHINHISNASNKFNSNSVRQIRNVGVFGEVKFDYDNTFYVSVTGRNDWISTLPSQNRSFFYPSVSMAYIFTQNIMKDNDILSFGKLRLSWAEVGKGPEFGDIGYFYKPSGAFPFGGIGGYESSSHIGDLNILPEKTRSWEIGADLRFFKNRLLVDYAYFNSTVNDQIFDVNLAYSSGYSRVTRNAGNYETFGHELLLIGKILDSKDLKWETTVNFTTSKGIVTDLPDDVEHVTFGGDGGPEFYLRVKEGDEIGTLYGYKWKYENGKRFITESGYPTIDDDDGYVIVGNAFPDYVVSLGNMVKWKSIGLNFLFEYKKGGDKYSWARRQMIRNGSSIVTEERNVENYILDGVMADPANDGKFIPNTTEITLDQNLYRSWRNYTGASEVYLQDASWLKLRTIGMSFDLSKYVKSVKFLRGVHLNVNANNILLWTPYDGYDPEGSAFSAGSNVYGLSGKGIPLSRSYTFGLKMDF